MGLIGYISPEQAGYRDNNDRYSPWFSKRKPYLIIECHIRLNSPKPLKILENELQQSQFSRKPRTNVELPSTNQSPRILLQLPIT